MTPGRSARFKKKHWLPGQVIFTDVQILQTELNAVSQLSPGFKDFFSSILNATECTVDKYTYKSDPHYRDG